MSSPEARRPKAVILGCAGTSLSDDERRLFREGNPLGFILFQRNCRDPRQVGSLVAAFRETVGRPDAPVLIDQEGGRVARLRPPHWQILPPAGAIGAIYAREPSLGLEAARLAGRIIAADLAPLGITVNCAPVLDVRDVTARSDVIGDRAYSTDPATVSALARSFSEGMLAGGVLSVVKHIPGHGRSHVDSHHELPVVDASGDALDAVDLAPFRALRDAPLAMTAHVLYAAWDGERPATTSASIVRDVIRGGIGFDGLLLSDDLSMKALAGTLAERATASLDAGCDVALHCNGDLAEMEAVAAACGLLSDAAEWRWSAAAVRLHAPEPFDLDPALQRLEALLAEIPTA